MAEPVFVTEKDLDEKLASERSYFVAEMEKRSIGEWDWSREREFTENLLCQRFDFLLVFYSLVVAGAYQTTSQLNFALAFLVGALICSLLSVSILRTHMKLERILCKLGEEHPYTLIEGRSKSGRRLVGYWIPLSCSGSLLAAALLGFSRHMTTDAVLPWCTTIPDTNNNISTVCESATGWLLDANRYTVLAVFVLLAVAVLLLHCWLTHRMSAVKSERH